MATSHGDGEQSPSSPSYEPPERPVVGGNPQQCYEMDCEPSDETRITEAQSRAERLLQLRAPLIERGKRVPALERSIASHELEATCLYDLLCTSRKAEQILRDRLDESQRETELESLETDMVRERLRAVEAKLAQATDLLHIKESAHAEEVAGLMKRCSNMKRKIEYLSTGQRNDFEERVKQLERLAGEARTERLDAVQERDQWRETAIASDEQVKVLLAKQKKAQTLSALLETERTRSASLLQKLEHAQKVAKNTELQKTKLSARDTDKMKNEKALEAEKARTAELRQKLKSSDANARKAQRDATKLRQQCDDLEKRLKDAVERAVNAEERAADLAVRPTTRSRGLPSPSRNMLISPAPLAFTRRPAEDVASESRSRFTATLPRGLEDEGSFQDEELDESTPSPTKGEITPRSKRKNTRPQKLAPPRTSNPKRTASSRRTTELESLRGPDTKKRRRTTVPKESNGPTEESTKTLMMPATPSDESPGVKATPRRKHGKATRKTTASSPARKRQEELQKDTGSTMAPRRTLRSRRQISYNYDEQGRDLVDNQDAIDVDFEALRPLPAQGIRETRRSKSKKSGTATSIVSEQQALRSSIDSPSTPKRSRRIHTIRKQVPGSRDRAR